MKQRVLLKGIAGLELLHRITSLDIKRLIPSVRQPGLVLNPQGKILAIFAITLMTGDEAELEYSAGFLELLDYYTFGEKYTLTPLAPQSNDASSESQRILNLDPKVGHEFNLDGTSNPLEINLTSAIHDQKGCYPGQEVIEKIISLGSPAKKLCLLACDEDLELKLPVELQNETGQLAGSLTSWQGSHGLAVLRKNFAHPDQKLFFREASANGSAPDSHPIPLTVKKVSS